jgi:hypothetical protein
MYTEMSSMTDQATASARATTPDAASGSSAGWTQDRITAEVQSALQEVLGRSLEPDEPFMSGEDVVCGGVSLMRVYVSCHRVRGTNIVVYARYV